MAAEPKNVEAEACIERELPKLDAGTDEDRLKALVSLDGSLRRLANRRAHPRMDSRRRLAKELMRLYEKASADSTQGSRIRDTIAQMLTSYGDDTIARPAILNILDHGTKIQRDRVLATLGTPGALSGPEFYSKIDELVAKGSIKESHRTTFLARIDKEKALPEILKVLKVSNDKESVLYAAWALQDYYQRPGDFALILRRVKEVGLDKSYDKRGDGLFWVNRELFSKYIAEASGDDLTLALDLVGRHAALRSTSGIPMLEKKLDDADPRVRELAAKALAESSASARANWTSMAERLRVALAKEQTPSVRLAMEDAIRRIDETEKEWQKLRGQQKRR